MCVIQLNHTSESKLYSGQQNLMNTDERENQEHHFFFLFCMNDKTQTNIIRLIV